VGGYICQRSIPAGGLFTGAEEVKTVQQQELFGGVAKAALDTCYHRVCTHKERIERERDMLGRLQNALEGRGSAAEGAAGTSCC
jgi:hypothetical protein